MEVLLIFVALITKHFIVDFPLQAFPYQYLNKGTYGHPGGVLHASLHVAGSFVALVPIIGYSALLMTLVLIEGVLHYHIDWAKMNINSKMGWQCNTTDKFWILLGADQYLHYMTYVGMVYAYIKLGA